MGMGTGASKEYSSIIYVKDAVETSTGELHRRQ
jgi:hypothetical protein